MFAFLYSQSFQWMWCISLPKVFCFILISAKMSRQDEEGYDLPTIFMVEVSEEIFLQAWCAKRHAWLRCWFLLLQFSYTWTACYMIEQDSSNSQNSSILNACCGQSPRWMVLKSWGNIFLRLCFSRVWSWTHHNMATLLQWSLRDRRCGRRRNNCYRRHICYRNSSFKSDATYSILGKFKKRNTPSIWRHLDIATYFAVAWVYQQLVLSCLAVSSTRIGELFEILTLANSTLNACEIEARCARWR